MEISSILRETIEEQDERKKESKSVDLAPNAMIANRRLTTAVLKKYLESNPKRKVITQQIKVLREKIKYYKRQGDNESLQKCENVLSELTGKLKKFDRAVIGRNKEEIDEYNNLVINDPEIKSIKKEIKELKKALKDNNIKSLLSKVRTLRSELKYKFTSIEEYKRFDFTLDIDEIGIPEAEQSLNVQYIHVMNKLAELTGYPEESLHNLSIRKIEDLLDEEKEANEGEMDVINSRILELNAQLETRKRAITGSNDLSSLLFDERTEHPEIEQDVHYTKSKNIIASSYVKYVENQAYRICTKLNMMHEFQEAISIGYEALAKSINNWEKAQRQSNVPISFEIFLAKSVPLFIERGLLDVTGNGIISGSSRADMYSRENTYIKKRMYELKVELGEDVPDEYLRSIIRDELGDRFNQGSVTKESDFISIVGGDTADSDAGDIWANALSDDPNLNASTEAESRETYEQLYDSLRKLFTLLRKRINPKTGEQQVTNQKFFDAEDQLLFLMFYGLKLKQLPDGTERMYTQKEMADELVEWNKKRGINKTMSQSAVSTKIAVLQNKIQEALKQNPTLRTGLRNIYEHYIHHSASMEKISMEDED